MYYIPLSSPLQQLYLSPTQLQGQTILHLYRLQVPLLQLIISVLPL